MSDFDVCLIGHAVEDWIFEPNKEPRHQWGGIFNVRRAFDFFKRRLNIEVQPSCFGKAWIHIDRSNCLKDVCANINLEARTTRKTKAKWAHYAYLNHLWHELDKCEAETISADLCEGIGSPFLQKLKDVDYLFCSIDEHDPRSLSHHTKGYVIAHDPKLVQIWFKDILMDSFPVKDVKNINPLGVGDFFAASFIYFKLLNYNDSEAIQESITHTGNFLNSR